MLWEKRLAGRLYTGFRIHRYDSDSSKETGRKVKSI
jgi:hypothetical protein